VPPPTSSEESDCADFLAGMSPLLTVVIPAFRAQETIGETLRSLRTSSNLLEVIVVENGSAELNQGSLEDDLGSALLRYVHLDEPDLSSARNRGLQKARGEFVHFLDADDLVDIDAIMTTLASFLPENFSALVLGRTDVEDISQAWSHPSDTGKQHAVEAMSGSYFLLRALATGHYSPVTGGYIFRRQALVDMALPFAEGFYHEDHAVVAGILARSDMVVRIDSVAFFKQSRRSSLSNTFPLEVSVEGYTKAKDDLRHTRQQLPRDSFFSRFALSWVVSRIDAIVSLKQFRALSGKSNRHTKAAITLLASATRYVLVSIVGRGVLVMACVASRYRRLRVREPQPNRVVSVRG